MAIQRNPILPGFNPDPSIVRVGEDCYSGADGNSQPAGPLLDASLIADGSGPHGEHGSFTGGLVGMAASDLNGTALAAGFSDFVYRPVRHESDRY